MRRPLCAAALLVTAAVSLILFFFPSSRSAFDQLNNEEVVLQGTVIDKQYRLSSGTGKMSLIITLGDYCFDSVGAGKKVPGVKNSKNVLVRIPVSDKEGGCSEDTLAAIGSLIKVSGTLISFDKPANHGEFDSALYYEVTDYDFEVRSAKLLAYSDSKDLIRNALYLLRRRISACIDSCFSDPDDAAIIKAMLIGEKGYISGELKDLYQDSGIIHLIAISGTHISLLGMGLFSFLKKLNIKTSKCAAVSSSVIILYAMMTGLSVSAFRAFFAFFIHMGAYLLHRTYDLLSAVSLCAIILIISKPEFLMYSGFVFSFCTVIAIGAIMPILPEKLGRKGMAKYLRSKSLAVPAATLPVYLYYYGSFPVYSVILNLFVLPLMTILMLFAVMVIFAGIIAVRAGAALSAVPHMILTAYKALSELSAKLPFHMEVTGHPYIWVIMIYIAVMLLLIVFEEHIPELVKILIIISSMLFLSFRFTNGLQIHAAYVGQGDALLITADGINITIDGGSTSKSDIAKYTLEPMLTYYGVGCIDYAVITHEDEDHVNGIIEIIKNGGSKGIYVKNLVLPDSEIENSYGDKKGSVESGLLEIQKLAQENGIPVIFFKRGDELRYGKLGLTCLNPVKGEMYNSSNAASNVLLLEYGVFSALFTGDLEAEAEEECLSYLKEENLLENGLTVLKVAHHGSANSSCSEFLSYVRPRFSIISCGVNNRYGHPHKDTLERLGEVDSKILDTRFCGEITIKTDGRKMTIRTMKDG